MDDNNRYNVLYLNKNSVCSTKSKSNESEKETKKSSGDLNNFNTGIPRHITAQKKETLANVFINKKLQISKFKCRALQNISALKLDFKSICAIAFKVCFCLLDLAIGVFFNARVHNILAVMLTVSFEVFVVLVFATSTILSAIIINIDEAYNLKSEPNNLKISPPKKSKELDKEDELKLKSSTITKAKSSTLISSKINSETGNKTFKANPQDLGNSEPTLSNQSSEHETTLSNLLVT